jgi:Holliday junction resolvasome RuvABC endonuclease subunit
VTERKPNGDARIELHSPSTQSHVRSICSQLGFKRLWQDNLIGQYQPSVIVLEDYAGKGSRRCQRIQWLINDISQLAAKQKIRVRSFSRAKVKQTFGESGASNKYEIAIAIAKRFPELTTCLPRFRNHG